MLRKILIIVVLIIAGIAGWLYFNPFKEPVFVAIKTIEVEKIEGNIAEVNAVAVFNNPNSIEATLLNTELKVFSNDALIGHVSQTSLTNIQSNSNFEIPLHFQIDLVKMGYSQSISGLLDNILNKQKVFPVKFDGYCRIKTFGTVHKIPVEFADELKFE
ncbi:MAG: hypothetical protein PSX81_09910 [bacterium]|nr:hypothetical protein [bacterium]